MRSRVRRGPGTAHSPTSMAGTGHTLAGMPPPDHGLVLGPILRRVDGTRAIVWVQTAHPATVEVQAGPGGGVARTFSAYGQHFAVVVVDGLPPDAATEYQVRIDGTHAW